MVDYPNINQGSKNSRSTLVDNAKQFFQSTFYQFTHDGVQDMPPQNVALKLKEFEKTAEARSL